MPKGKHKGGKRCFTNFDELQQQKLKEQKEKEWRKARGQDEDDSDEDEEAEEKAEGGSDEEGEEEEESEEESDEEEQKPKAKGIQGLIEIENPNHVTQKLKKLSTLDSTPGSGSGSAAVPKGPPTSKGSSANSSQLSRKQREEIERQRAAANYRRLHAQGKTDEAKADLERLALIRKQREEAQKRKEEEKKAKDAAAAAKREKVAKALNKKENRD